MSKRFIRIDDSTYQVELTVKEIKNAYLRVSDEGVVRISSNRRFTDQDIIRFITKNKKKVDKTIHDKLIAKSSKTERISLQGKNYNLRFETGNKWRFEDNELTIKGRNLTNKEELVEKFKLNYAKEILSNIFYEVFADLDLKREEPSLQIRKMKTRWGVCHVSKNKIVLNSELIKFQPEIIRYVIIHELMHFYEANHSKSFWKLVQNYVPNYKEIRQLMK